MNELISKPFSFNKKDIKDILKGTGMAMAGAGALYVIAILDVIDVSAYDPIFAALMSSAINALRIFVRTKVPSQLVDELAKK